jgi:hypothetical protein
LAKLPENPELDWASNRKNPKDAVRIVHVFCKFSGKTPTELLELQTKALTSTDIDERDAALILLEKFIESVKGRRSTKLLLLSNMRSFFEFHRRPLPPTRRTWLKSLKSDFPKVEGHISPDELQTIVRALSGDPRRLSMFLVQLQSFSGPRELRIIDNTMGVYIGEQIKNGANLIDLHFTEGRKHSDKAWHTYIGKEACGALRKWFAIHGYPTIESPYIWPSQKPQTLGQGLTESAARQAFDRLVARLGMRPKIGSGKKTDRYGKSVKELRDLALSFSQQAVGKENELDERFQESSAEYFAGHTVDELGYRKLHDLDPDYRKRQYLIVEPYLSPLTNPNGVRLQEHEKELEEMKERLNRVADVVKFTARGSSDEQLRRLSEIVEAMTRGEGAEITKEDVKEAKQIAGKLRKMADYLSSGNEPTPSFEIESYVTQERAKQLIMRFYEAMTSESPTTSKVKKLDFDAIVHPKRKRAPK